MMRSKNQIESHIIESNGFKQFLIIKIQALTFFRKKKADYAMNRH